MFLTPSSAYPNNRLVSATLPFCGDFAAENLAPILAGWDDAFMRPHPAMGLRIGAGRFAAGSNIIDRLEQQPAHEDDRAVGGAEMLMRAIDERARAGFATHAFLEREILRVDAFDAGEILRLLHLPIDQVIVREVALQAEGAGNEIVLAAAIGLLDRLVILVRDRRR